MFRETVDEKDGESGGLIRLVAIIFIEDASDGQMGVIDPEVRRQGTVLETEEMRDVSVDIAPARCSGGRTSASDGLAEGISRGADAAIEDRPLG